MRSFMVVILLLSVLAPITLANGDDLTLYGPIAHIDIEHEKLDDHRYFRLDGHNSYMHSGRLVDHNWTVTRNDTEIAYHHGPFLTLENHGAEWINISFTVTSDDTRFDTKTATIHVKDDGYGMTTMTIRVENDPRLVEKLEEERTIIEEKDPNLLLYYVIIGALAGLLMAAIIVIIVQFNRKQD